MMVLKYFSFELFPGLVCLNLWLQSSPEEFNAMININDLANTFFVIVFFFYFNATFQN